MNFLSQGLKILDLELDKGDLVVILFMSMRGLMPRMESLTLRIWNKNHVSQHCQIGNTNGARLITFEFLTLGQDVIRYEDLLSEYHSAVSVTSRCTRNAGRW